MTTPVPVPTGREKAITLDNGDRILIGGRWFTVTTTVVVDNGVQLRLLAVVGDGHGLLIVDEDSEWETI